MTSSTKLNISDPVLLKGGTQSLGTILVVDDEKLQRDLISAVLASHYTIRTADSAAEAVIDAAKVRPSLVIMDYQMPEVNGIEGFKQLRALHPGLPVIFVTGYADLEVAREAFRLGAAEYIIKPFEPWDLVTVVDRCVLPVSDEWAPQGASNVELSFAAKRRLAPNVDLWRSDLPTVPSANRALVDMDGGNQVEAKVLRLGRDFVRTEIFDPLVPLDAGGSVRHLKVWVGDELAYDGHAALRVVIDTGVSHVCEFTMNGGWVDKNNTVAAEVADIENDARTFIREAGVMGGVRAGFKLAVTDAASFLSEMRTWCDAVELKWSRRVMERETMERLLREVTPALQKVFARFEAEAALVSDTEMSAHLGFLRSALHPLVLCSPFIHRCYTKPLGYPGDYGVMNRMLDMPFEGDSLFARILNAWVVRSAAGDAYRNRVGYLENVLAREATRHAERGGICRALSLGCGAARETQLFVQRHPVSERVAFTLLDFNADTVRHAEEQINAVAAEAGRTVSLDPREFSVQQMLAAGTKLMNDPRLLRSGPAERGAFNVLYCAGLFDYLSDRICTRLLEIFWELAAPGAVIVATNFAPSNPIRHFMDYVLDWRLIYRDEDMVRALACPACAADDVKITPSPGRVEVILEMRKPESPAAMSRDDCMILEAEPRQ